MEKDTKNLQKEFYDVLVAIETYRHAHNNYCRDARYITKSNVADAFMVCPETYSNWLVGIVPQRENLLRMYTKIGKDYLYHIKCRYADVSGINPFIGV